MCSPTHSVVSSDCEEDEQERKRKGCVAGSLQCPGAGEPKEGEDNGTSERKQCADGIEDRFNEQCGSHNSCLGCCSRQEHAAIPT